jgi:hypothetical protein
MRPGELSLALFFFGGFLYCLAIGSQRRNDLSLLFSLLSLVLAAVNLWLGLGGAR